MKRVFSILFTLTLAVSLVLTPAVATNAAEPESESGLLPPSITPVVILQGSDYEMGYQYYQQLYHLFGSWVLEKVVHAPFTTEELTALQAYQYYIRQSTPELIHMMVGMADGATDVGIPLTYVEVLAYYTGTRAYPGTEPPGSEEEELPPEGCSTWAAWGSTTADERLICGYSSDVKFKHMVAIVAFPDDGNNYMGALSAGSIWGWPFMNNKGVFMSATDGGARRDIDKYRGYDVPSDGLIQHIMRFADSAQEVEDIWLSTKQAYSMCILASDVSGPDALVFETSAAFNAVREPGDFGETDFIYAANNYFTDEGGEAVLGEEFVEHAGWLGRSMSISSQGRNLEMWNMFHNYQGEVDLDFAKMIWRYPGDPPPYPMGLYYGEYWETQGEGWNQQICNLNSAKVHIALPDDGDEGIMYICTGPAGRVAYPLAPEDSDWYQIEGTHTFYQLKLASTPSRVVSAAYWTTVEGYIREAYHALMWLNYTDTGYAWLNELYSMANAEFYEGVNWRTKAKLASGNEQLLYYSKALTAFTRAQAHANQVLHALVPPATSPEDLGLGEYLGPWAEWATR